MPILATKNRWTLYSPAKLNLSLRVLGKRRDGFHALSSIFAYCGWRDELVLTRLENNDKNIITCNVSGPHAPTGLTDDHNLAVRAYHFAVQKFGDLPAIELSLKKNIPPGAGLGGGSGNAAAMLRWALDLHSKPTKTHPLSCSVIDSIRSTLGADTYPIFEGIARQWTGTGDVAGPAFLPQKKLWVLVVFPNAIVSTKSIFIALKQPPSSTQWDEIEIWEEAINGPNDLQVPALDLSPPIARLLDSMHKACTNTGNADDDAIKVQMSGSGSACFALFHSEVRALEAAQHPDLVRFPQFVGPLQTKAWGQGD